MPELDEQVVAALDAAVLGWLATADEHGMPNVSPKEVFAHLGGDRVVIAHIASPRSARNAKANPQGCFSVVDVFRQRGFKLTGALHLHAPDDERFDAVAGPLRVMVGDRFALRGVFELTVEAVAPIVAPSYTFHADEVSEESMVAGAMKAYGVRPASP
ncbi:MAG TPA: pyridoxamine 5'-phosphate oxidase family protein [Acidimicrobiales bacterium]|nr:pyridoxamine 5'-phosphate oxidase family protein [Acidimicrobiales bacterium]